MLVRALRQALRAPPIDTHPCMLCLAPARVFKPQDLLGQHRHHLLPGFAAPDRFSFQ